VSSSELHTDRARAGSFGSVARQYDRHRPAYPGALIDDLAASRPSAVLDVGCGTGKAAVALAERGLSVLGVEPDERMAEVALGHGVPVEVAEFETWDAAGRRFDLVTCADAWHWIDPARGIPKAAEVLRPGGTLARFWNYHLLEEQAVAALDAVYRRHAPEAHTRDSAPGDRTDPGTADPTSAADRAGSGGDPLARSDAFGSLEPRTYRWEHTLSADEWVALVATFSDHQCLGQERLSVLQRGLHAAIEDLGGTVRASSATFALLAKRVEN